MSDKMLSFSNINLFGHVVDDIKMSDPDKPIVVQAMTIEPNNRTGHGDVEGKPIKQGDLVLVRGQKKKGLHNGLYEVLESTKDWQLKNLEIDAKFKFKPLGKRNKLFGYGRPFTQFKQATTKFSVSRDIAGNTAELLTLEIEIGGVDTSIIGGNSIDLPAGLSNPEIADKIALTINEDYNTMFTAKSKGNTITLTGAAREGDFTEEVEGTDDNLTLSAIPVAATILFSGGRNQKVKIKNISRENRGFRKGINKQLESQIYAEDARLARIYGFSYEGVYYDIPKPVLFVVHGDGKKASGESQTVPDNALTDNVSANTARAPRNVNRTGLAASGFDFADDMKVWSYDQADYTIRMDIETGMFEQVLLDAMLDDGGSPDARGMNARGMNARGMNARGMNARGMNARGMNARGGNSD